MTEFNPETLNVVADVEAPGEALTPALLKFAYDLRDNLPQFVVYDHPKDFPDHYVARMWLALPLQPVRFVLRAATLDALRDFLATLGLVHLSRSPEDDASILEVWM
jgi:hypothetical protein